MTSLGWHLAATKAALYDPQGAYSMCVCVLRRMLVWGIDSAGSRLGAYCDLPANGWLCIRGVTFLWSTAYGQLAVV